MAILLEFDCVAANEHDIKAVQNCHISCGLGIFSFVILCSICRR